MTYEENAQLLSLLIDASSPQWRDHAFEFVRRMPVEKRHSFASAQEWQDAGCPPDEPVKLRDSLPWREPGWWDDPAGRKNLLRADFPLWKDAAGVTRMPDRLSKAPKQ